MAKKNSTLPNAILERLAQNSTIPESDILEQSVFFNEKDVVPTDIFMLNVALSGSFEGGMYPGHTMFAGPSKHFKTGLLLIMMKAYLNKHKDAAALFYDSEFGTGSDGKGKSSYFSNFGIDPARVLHSPIPDIEVLKFDIMNQITNLKRGDHVFIGIDSIGNLASKKEVEDALKQSDKADMTRAKQLKSLFRMVTPYLYMKDIPLVTVNHTYKTMELFAKDVVGGGTGSYYSADNIFIIGREQEKDSEGVKGFHFKLKTEKSRFVKEKSMIPLYVDFKKGISRWSGLLELAIESGHIEQTKLGKKTAYKYPDDEKIYTEDETETKDFWYPILKQQTFQDFVKDKYKLENPKEAENETAMAEE